MIKHIVYMFLVLLGAVHQAQAIDYRPPNGARIWDPSIIWHDGKVKE